MIEVTQYKRLSKCTIREDAEGPWIHEPSGRRFRVTVDDSLWAGMMPESASHLSSCSFQHEGRMWTLVPFTADPPRMRTGREFAIAKGLLKEPPEGLRGRIPASVFEAAGLPMVVACSGCGMTMSLLGPSCRVDQEDRCWCADCAGEDA